MTGRTAGFRLRSLTQASLGPAPGLAGKPTGHVRNSTERKNSTGSCWDEIPWTVTPCLHYAGLWCRRNGVDVLRTPEGPEERLLVPSKRWTGGGEAKPALQAGSILSARVGRGYCTPGIDFHCISKSKTESHTTFKQSRGKNCAHRYTHRLPELITCWEKTPQLQEDVSVMSFGCTRL